MAYRRLRTTARRNATAILRDQLIQRDIYLSRVVNRSVVDVLRRQGRLVDTLERLLRDRFGWIATRGFDSSDHTLRRLEANLSQLRAAITEATTEIAGGLRSNLIAVGRAEQLWLPRAMERAMGPVAKMLKVGKHSPYNIGAILSDRPIGGALFKEWKRTLGENTFRRVTRSIRHGMLRGDSVDAIVRDTFGKSVRTAAGWVRQGGIVPYTTRDAETWVRTSYGAVSNEARMELYQDNLEVIKGYQWVATLDDATCEECGIRDGHVYDPETFEPMDGGAPWEGGPGNLHPNDRCTSVAVLKSFEEMGLASVDLPDEFRQSMDGLVPAKVSWRDWAANQDPETLVGALGKTRAAAVARGEVRIADLFNDRGQLLTLEEAGLRIEQRPAAPAKREAA